MGRGKTAGGNNCCACEADEIGADVAVGATVVGAGVGVVVGAAVAALTAVVGVTGVAVAVKVASGSQTTVARLEKSGWDLRRMPCWM